MSLNKPLPVKSIFVEALSLPAKHWQVLLKAATPLIVAITLMATYTSMSFNADVVTFDWMLLPIGLAFYVTLVVAIIICHRVVIIGEDAINQVSMFNWTGNEIRYIGWCIGLAIVALVLMIPMTLVVAPFMSTLVTSPLVAGSIVFIAGIPVMYAISRWSLLLPATAVDVKGKTLTDAWELSKGNGWRLTLLVGVLPVLMDFVFALIPEAVPYAIRIFLQYALWLIVGVVEVGLLSLCFKYLAWSDDEPGDTDEVPSVS